jgi:hypothetical protein
MKSEISSQQINLREESVDAMGDIFPRGFHWISVSWESIDRHRPSVIPQDFLFDSIMLNISPNSSFVRDTSGITTDRLKTLLNQSSQRQSINRDKQAVQKRILFSVIFVCLVQLIV